jgi:hypothetical protein
VQKYAWTQILAGLAEETDYDNFKSAVARHQGRARAASEHSLHEVWSVMNRLQRYAPATNNATVYYPGTKANSALSSV